MPNAFARSEVTDRLIRYLSQMDKGAHVTYAELSNASGILVTSRTAKLISARAILEREHNAVWCCVKPGVGLWRLTDPEIAERQRTWYLRGARNKLKAGASQADVVEIDALDITQQARFATDSIIRELAREALSKATQRRIERVSRGTSNDLPAFSAVEWMISLSPKRAAGA